MHGITNIEEQDQGAQGYIQRCVWNDKPVIMKLSNHIDFVLELEEEVWERLKLFNSIHFCKVLTKIPINPGERRYQLVFEEITHHEPKNSISLRKTTQRAGPSVVKKKIAPKASERPCVVKNDSLANLLYDAKHKVIALMNCLNQTLAAIIMYQNLGITHYDLHVDNVMITNTEYDIHVYKLEHNTRWSTPDRTELDSSDEQGIRSRSPSEQGRIVAIKTFGLSPVIIDFGMAYVPDSRYNATCMFANNGFTTFMPDHHVDARLLLITAVKDLEYVVKDYKNGFKAKTRGFKDGHVGNRLTSSNNVSVGEIKISELYIKLIKSIYGNLKIQENGWFLDNCFNNIIHEIVNSMPKILNQRKGGIFKKKNLEWTFELMQHEIQLPLKHDNINITQSCLKLKQSQLSKAILLFASEWVYVEQIIRNTKEEQLFLKDLVSMDESLKSYCTMKHRYPKMKNLKNLKTCCKAVSEIFCQLLNNYKKKIEAKKSLMYSKLLYKTTEDILISLPKQPIKYEKDMKLNFINTSGSQKSFNLTIDEIMVNKLNENEQKTLQEIFRKNKMI